MDLLTKVMISKIGKEIKEFDSKVMLSKRLTAKARIRMQPFFGKQAKQHSITFRRPKAYLKGGV